MTPQVIRAYLGWRNTEPDTAQMRLYVTDDPPPEGNGDRWDARFPGGHVVEYAAIEREGGEGDKYLVVRVGNRFTPDETVDRVVQVIEDVLTEGPLW